MICICDLATKLVGDGCEVCNPKLALEYAKQTIKDQEEAIKELVDALSLMRWHYPDFMHGKKIDELLAKYKTPSE